MPQGEFQNSALVWEAIVGFEALIQWLDGKLDGLQFENSVRSRLSAACHYAALEHQKAILLLTAKGLRGPAFSLSRHIYEAFIRGVWLLNCADEAALDGFQKDKTPTMGQMLKAIEAQPGYEEGTLSAIKDTSWVAMCSYAHTGFQHIVRLMVEDGLEPCHTDDEVLQLLRFSNLLGCLSAVEVCKIANDVELMNEIYQRMRSDFDESGTPPESS